MFALSTQENNLYSLQTRRAAATPKAETNTEAQTATVTVAIERQVSASASLFLLFCDCRKCEYVAGEQGKKIQQRERWMKWIIKWAKVCANNARCSKMNKMNKTNLMKFKQRPVEMMCIGTYTLLVAHRESLDTVVGDMA